jgi:hypothetical protein
MLEMSNITKKDTTRPYPGKMGNEMNADSIMALFKKSIPFFHTLDG